jgi:hypothetical protein
VVLVTRLAPVFGILAALVAVVDVAPYLRDTLRGTTRPHRATWLIWAVLATVVCGSQRADGASWSLAMAATQAVLTSVVFVLAIPLGEGRFGPWEALLLAIAAAGTIGWLAADTAVVATCCVVAADLLAAVMMVPKTWRDPGSETASTFVLASVSGALAALSVATFSVALLLYPLYYCIANGALAALILRRRAVLPAPTYRAA